MATYYNPISHNFHLKTTPILAILALINKKLKFLKFVNFWFFFKNIPNFPMSTTKYTQGINPICLTCCYLNNVIPDSMLFSPPDKAPKNYEKTKLFYWFLTFQ